MLVPCLAPRTVLELLNPGGTFRVRDGILLDPAPDPLAKVESLENLAASQADASILREFCRPGCRSVQLDLEGVGGAVPCVLSVLAGDEEALVGVRVLQLETLHQDKWSDGAGAGLDCGPDEATIGIEQLYDFHALEASLLGDTKHDFHDLEASLLGDTKRPFTAISESESEVSWIEVAALEALERECQELRLKLEAADRSNAKLTAEVRAFAAEQEKVAQTPALNPASETAPLVIKLALKQPERSSEKVAAAVQTDNTPPPSPTKSRKTGVTGFEAGSHPRWLAGVLNAGFEAQMSKNLSLPSPPPVEAEAAGRIGKLLMKGGLAYHPKLGWHQAAPSKRFTSKVAPDGEAASCAESGYVRRASDTTDTLEWAKSVQPRRKHFTKKTVVVCPDPPTTLPQPI